MTSTKPPRGRPDDRTPREPGCSLHQEEGDWSLTDDLLDASTAAEAAQERAELRLVAALLDEVRVTYQGRRVTDAAQKMLAASGVWPEVDGDLVIETPSPDRYHAAWHALGWARARHYWALAIVGRFPVLT